MLPHGSTAPQGLFICFFFCLRKYPEKIKTFPIRLLDRELLFQKELPDFYRYCLAVVFINGTKSHACNLPQVVPSELQFLRPGILCTCICMCVCTFMHNQVHAHMVSFQKRQPEFVYTKELAKLNFWDQLLTQPQKKLDRLQKKDVFIKLGLSHCFSNLFGYRTFPFPPMKNFIYVDSVCAIVWICMWRQ